MKINYKLRVTQSKSMLKSMCDMLQIWLSYVNHPSGK